MSGIDRDTLLELLSEETGWEWEGEQDEPAPIFGCDTRVPSSRQALEAFADRILALARPVAGPSAQEIADWFEREAEPGDPTDWRLRTARTIRHEWDLS